MGETVTASISVGVRYLCVGGRKGCYVERVSERSAASLSYV